MSHNSVFFAHNCEFTSHNYDFFSQNCKIQYCEEKSLVWSSYTMFLENIEYRTQVIWITISTISS